MATRKNRYELQKSRTSSVNPINIYGLRPGRNPEPAILDAQCRFFESTAMELNSVEQGTLGRSIDTKGISIRKV
jgi:hypothetical protein